MAASISLASVTLYIPSIATKSKIYVSYLKTSFVFFL